MSLMTSIRAATMHAAERVSREPLRLPGAITWRPGEMTLLWTAAPSIAKRQGEKVDTIARELVNNLQSDDVGVKSVRPNGMIELAFKTDALAKRLGLMQRDPRLGVPPLSESSRVIVDYSQPNVAKEMHVGHLRSTVIGDAIARLFKHRGYDVLLLNHIGDWGTQFGMLIQYLEDERIDVATLTLSDLGKVYRQAKKRFDTSDLFAKVADQVRTGVDKDPSEISDLANKVKALLSGGASDVVIDNAVAAVLAAQNGTDPATFTSSLRTFAQRARESVVRLQAHDPLSISVWKEICQVSKEGYQKVYEELGVLLATEGEARGESWYNPYLGPVTDDLLHRGVAKIEQGAVCAFHPDYSHPFMVRKSNGGYTYDTTDLAALKQRTQEEKAKRIIYVVDMRQRIHFEQLKWVGEAAGYLDPKETRFDYVGFGTVCGADKKPFKTRSGQAALLKDLVHVAIYRAAKELRIRDLEREKQKAEEAGAPTRAILEELEHLSRRAIEDMTPEECEGLMTLVDRKAAEILGIGALKYFDLKNNRVNDYVFNSDQMLNLKGNSIAYLQYALVRMKKVQEKADLSSQSDLIENENNPAEQRLGLQLLTYPDALAEMEEKLEPHQLCQFLYDLAGAYNAFYHDCRIQGNRSRLELNALAQAVMEQGLGILGIQCLNEM